MHAKKSTPQGVRPTCMYGMVVKFKSKPKLRRLVGCLSCDTLLDFEGYLQNIRILKLFPQRTTVKTDTVPVAILCKIIHYQCESLHTNGLHVLPLSENHLRALYRDLELTVSSVL